MNRNIFENMQEQIEPSERLVSLLRTKIAQESASKPAKSFMKWMPLTAAACVLLIGAVLLLPYISTPPELPPAYPSELFPTDTDMPAPMTAQEIEDMTDEEFLDAFLNNKFVIPSIYMPDDFGVPLIKGEYRTYSWGNPGAAVCVESAEQLIINPGFIYHELEFIGENDYYYSFRITTTFFDGDIAAIRWFIFKDGVVSGFDRAVIHMLDTQSFTDIADIMFSAMWFTLLDDCRVIYRDVEETEGTFIYTYYLAEKAPRTNYVSLTKRVNVTCRLSGDFIGYETITELKRVSLDTPKYAAESISDLISEEQAIGILSNWQKETFGDYHTMYPFGMHTAEPDEIIAASWDDIIYTADLVKSTIPENPPIWVVQFKVEGQDIGAYKFINALTGEITDIITQNYQPAFDEIFVGVN
jgi:hypothetical protein